MRIKVGWEAYQLQGMPFGWGLSPWWSQKMTRPIRAWLHQQKIKHAWYVDDVTVLGKTAQEAEHNTTRMINMLSELGVRVNNAKCMTRAAQLVEHLGHKLDMKSNKCLPLAEKLDKSIKVIKKQMQGRRFQPRNLAGVAGVLMDMSKSITQLHGLP